MVACLCWFPVLCVVLSRACPCIHRFCCFYTLGQRIVEGIVKVNRAVVSVVFGKRRPATTIPKNSSFGDVVSIKHANVPTMFVKRANGSRMNQHVAAFLGGGHMSPACLEVESSVRSTMSLTFLSRRGSTQCVFCGRPPHDLRGFEVPRIRTSSVIRFNSCCTVGPSVHPRVGTFLACTGRHGTVLFCSLGCQGACQGHVRRLLPIVRRGFQLTGVIHNSTSSFRVVCKVHSTRRVCRQRVTPCYPLFVYARKTRTVVLYAPGSAVHFGIPPVLAIDAVKTKSGFGTKFVCKLIHRGVKRASLYGLSTSR